MPVESREGSGYSTTIPKHFSTGHKPKDIIMKLRKNLEAVFLVAAVVTNFASYAVASVQAGVPVKAAHAAPAAPVAPVAQAAQAVDQNVPVVVVTGHRLSAAEKAALN
jgi:hypothetical protein